MKKSLSIETMFLDYSFYDRFRLVREAGFDYVEFGVWTDLDLQRIRELQSEYLLHIAGIAGDRGHALTIPDAREDFLEYLSQSVAVARYFNCPNLIITSNADAEGAGGGDPSISDFTKIAAATRALLDASKQAERAGITLLLKPIGIHPGPNASVNPTPSAGDVVRVVNSARLRLLYDVTKMRDVEGDILQTVRKYRDLIGYVHIGGELDGDGDIDLRWFKKVLVDELAYDGFVGFEFRTSRDMDDCLRLIHDF